MSEPKLTDTHKVMLIDPNGGTEWPCPAIQVQHYLDKGFKRVPDAAQTPPEEQSPVDPSYKGPPRDERPRGVTSTKSMRRRKSRA